MTDDQLKSEGWHAALASSTRRRVLELLANCGEALDAVAVAQAMSLHVTTARFHLEQLEAVGLVRREVLRVPGQRGRPRVLFSIPAAPADGAAPGGSGAPQVDMQEQLSRALISVLSEDPDGGRARAVRAGENWSMTLPASVLADADQVEPAADQLAPFEITRSQPSPAAQGQDESAPIESASNGLAIVGPVPVPAPVPVPVPVHVAPDGAAATVPDVAAVTVPDVAAVTGPDVAPTTVPDAALGTVSDEASATAPVDLGALRRTHRPGGVAGPYLTVLDGLGFAPELQGDRVVALRECPFRAEARENPGVVCSVHLGLMRGVARSLGQNEDEVGLRPFVTPNLCLVDLPGSRADATAV